MSQKRLRIGIDTRSLANLEKSGVEGYVANLVENLPLIGQNIDWYFLVDSRAKSTRSKYENVNIVRIPVSREKFFWPLVSLYCRQKRLDLFHFPIALVPDKFPVPAAITIYDLASEVYPQFYSAKELAIHRQLVKRSVREQSAGILTISQSTKRDLIKFYQADPAKIYVTYLSPEITKEGVLKKPPVDFRFILCVGNIQPRKNFVKAVEAFAKLAKPDLHLVIAGKYQDGAELARIKEAIAQYQLEQRIHITGYVDRRQLNNFYAHTELLLYPSFYEGFGIPLLEAFYFKKPVVTAKISSMPEIARDAAIYCQPDSVDSIVKALQKALDPKQAPSFAQAGKRRLAELQKDPLAESTLKAYQTIINKLK